MILRGLLRIAVTALISFALAWTLAELSAGSAAERAAAAAGTLPPEGAASARARAAVIEDAARIHDLGGVAPARIARATARLAVLDLGRSWRDRRPVGEVLGDAAPVTARIGLLAMVLAIAGGIVAGAAAARARGLAAIAIGAGTALAAALPSTWLGLMLVDAGGRGELAAALVLALAPGAAVAVQVRAALAEFLAGPLATAVRARGLAEPRLAVHGLRLALPALAPLVTSVGAYALGASVVVERIFALPGLGRVTLDAAGRGDAPVLAGVAALAGAIVAALSVLADALAAWADPRLRENAA